MEFWLVENAVNLVVPYVFTGFWYRLLKGIYPVEEGRSHQLWVIKILTKNRVIHLDDLLLRSLVITFDFILLFVDLEHMFKEVVVVFDVRSWELNLIFNLQVFSGFDYPGFSLAWIKVLSDAYVDIETEWFKYPI